MPDDRKQSDPLRGTDLLALGGQLIGSVVGFTVLGIVIDHFAGTSPLGAIIGVGLGIVAGAIGFVSRARRALRAPAQHDPEQHDPKHDDPGD